MPNQNGYFLIAVWFCVSALSTVVDKVALRHHDATFVTCFQLGVILLGSLFLTDVLKMEKREPLSWSLLRRTFPLAFGQLASLMLSNYALQHTTIHVFQTCKALLPLATIPFAFVLLRQSPSMRDLARFSPVIFGVMLTSAAEVKLDDSIGLAAALATTFLEAFQNTHSKKEFQPSSTSHPSHDDDDGDDDGGGGGGTSSSGDVRSSSSSSYIGPAQLMFNLTLTNFPLTVCLVTWRSLFTAPHVQHRFAEMQLVESVYSPSLISPSSALLLLAGPLGFFRLYLAFRLHYTFKVVTFGLISISKRTVTLFAAALLLNQYPSAWGILGISMVILGSALYLPSDKGKPATIVDEEDMDTPSMQKQRDTPMEDVSSSPPRTGGTVHHRQRMDV